MIALVSLFYFAAAWANSPDLITSERTQTENFQYLHSKNCGKIFYLPSNYEMEQEKSSVLLGSLPVNGSQRPAVRIFIALKPKVNEPDQNERSQVKSWFKRIGVCPEANPQFAPYPDYMIDLTPPDVSHASQVFATKIERLSEGRKVLRIEVADTPAAIGNILEVLSQYSPQLSYQIINEILVARSTLRVNIAGAAEFLKEIFYRRTCYYTESWDWLGQKSKDEHCDYTPEVTVTLKKAEAEGVIEFDDDVNIGAPANLVSIMHARLLSRMALSTFETSVISKVNEMLRVELGNLKKSVQSSYEDTIKQEELVTDYAGRPIEIANLAAFVGAQLKQWKR